MSQSRISSLAESVLNTASGFLISLVVWHVVGPWFGYTVTWSDNFLITSIFTVVSVARSYAWRRWFNGRIARRFAEHDIDTCRCDVCSIRRAVEEPVERPKWRTFVQLPRNIL